jgi:hypothetical protein
LIKRFNHHERIVPVESDLLGAKHLLVSRAAFPRLKGFMPNAVTPTLAPVGDYNFVNMTLLNYITLGYAGARGAIRWKFSPTQAANAPMQIRAEHRNVRFGQTNLYDESTQTITTSLQNPLEIVRRAVTGGAFPGDAQVGPFTGLAGGALNHSSVNGTLEIEIPYYTPLRFEPGKRNNYEVRDLDYDRGYPYDRVLQLDVNYLMTNADIKVATLDAYVAAGEDFTTYFFTGAPPLFYRATLPTVV